jgi:hypothetical protein
MRVHHDSGDNQTGIVLVVCRHDKPRRCLSARRIQALFKRFGILLPILSFVDIRKTELPVLVRLVNPVEETLALLLL